MFFVFHGKNRWPMSSLKGRGVATTLLAGTVAVVHPKQEPQYDAVDDRGESSPMAPRYAPSLRSRLPPLALFLQVTFIVLFVFFVEIEVRGDTTNGTFVSSYGKFQDVHVMVFLGFGFLASFLVRYGFSSLGFGMLVAALAVQWAVLLNGFLFSHLWNGKFLINMKSLIDAELCAASALVAVGAVHGMTNPVQLLLLTLVEVTGFVTNQWIIQRLFMIHIPYGLLLVFGSLCGVTVSWVLFRSEAGNKFEKEKLSSKSGLFSMMGCLFLWMFWPSFNFVVVNDNNVLYSTYLSLSVSAVTAMAISVLSSPKGKINMVHVQSSTLAGGVAIGAATTTVKIPWIAMTIGLCATLLSSLGFRYMRKHMRFAFECHDACGVLNVYTIPGILGWSAHLFLRLGAISDATIAVRFAVHHICVLLVTLSMSLLTGLITGFIIKLRFWRTQQNEKCFDDQPFWEFPHLAVRK